MRRFGNFTLWGRRSIWEPPCLEQEYFYYCWRPQVFGRGKN